VTSIRLIESAGLTDIYEKVMLQQRLTADDGLKLYLNPNLNAVGALANIVRERVLLRPKGWPRPVYYEHRRR
jgi:2-iminoacetate synthase ThiH